MSTRVKPIPESYHSITPNLVSTNASGAIDFYKKVFGATERGGRAVSPDGKIIHAELDIGDSVIFVNDATGASGSLGSEPKLHPLQLHLYVQDADAVFNRALAAGARVDMPLQNMFWGDRYGKIIDPFGHVWAIATHVEDVAPQEMERRMREFFAKAAGQK
jgi:PhnB protein